MANKVTDRDSRFTLRINSELLKKLKIIAIEKEKSTSQLINDAIKEYLEKEDKIK